MEQKRPLLPPNRFQPFFTGEDPLSLETWGMSRKMSSQGTGQAKLQRLSHGQEQLSVRPVFPKCVLSPDRGIFLVSKRCIHQGTQGGTQGGLVGASQAGVARLRPPGHKG